MADTHTIKTEEISIIAAVETLSRIAELELSSTLKDVTLLIPDENESVVMKTVRWLHKKNAERMREIVCENLRVVLSHLRHFYATAKDRFSAKESFEGIRTIMLLVDEATENVDKYSRVFLGTFQGGVRQTKEFAKLCSFYRKKIVPIFSDQRLASWVSGLSARQLFAKMIAPTLLREGRLLLEAERMARDLDYELAFLKQPRGEPFLTPHLVRDLQLYSDVSEGVRAKSEGLEEEIHALSNFQAATEVSYLLRSAYPFVDAFFRLAHQSSDQPLVRTTYSPCIALFAASLYSMYHTPVAKGLLEYFDDFRYLLQQLVYLPEFQKLLAYPPTDERTWQYRAFRLVEELSARIFKGAPISREMNKALQVISHQAIEKYGTFKTAGSPLSERLSELAKSMFQFIGERRDSASGLTMRKVRENKWCSYEPLLSESIPTHLCDLCWGQRVIPIIRMPSPTHQEYVNSSQLSEVLQVAIRQKLRAPSRTLFINLQDPENWREQARCSSIDELGNREGLDYHFFTITLSRNSSFYEQDGPYESASSLRSFTTNLHGQLMAAMRNASSLPAEEDWGGFLETCISTVESFVFDGKHALPRSHRQVFIDVLQGLLILKLIDTWQPDTIIFSCKDGLDLSLSSIGTLFGLLTWLHDREVSEEDMSWLRVILFGIPLVQRARPIFHECCYRLIRNLVKLEGAKNATELLQALDPLFPRGALHAVFRPNFDR